MNWSKKEVDYTQIDTSSKVNAKLSCLKLCDNNVVKAKELYDFVIGDLKGIPEVSPKEETIIGQIKGVATETWEFLNNNQDQLIQAYNVFQLMRGKGTLTAAAPVVETATEIPNI